MEERRWHKAGARGYIMKSVKTIESLRANIKNKLGLKSAIELVQHAALWVRQQSAG